MLKWLIPLQYKDLRYRTIKELNEFIENSNQVKAQGLYLTIDSINKALKIEFDFFKWSKFKETIIC